MAQKTAAERRISSVQAPVKGNIFPEVGKSIFNGTKMPECPVDLTGKSYYNFALSRQSAMSCIVSGQLTGVTDSSVMLRRKLWHLHLDM